LPGENLRHADGRLIGVLDWDLACAWDHASMRPASPGMAGTRCARRSTGAPTSVP